MLLVTNVVKLITAGDKCLIIWGFLLRKCYLKMSHLFMTKDYILKQELKSWLHRNR